MSISPCTVALDASMPAYKATHAKNQKNLLKTVPAATALKLRDHITYKTTHVLGCAVVEAVFRAIFLDFFACVAL